MQQEAENIELELPQEEEFCFYHPKDIDRQEKQNEFYGNIDSDNN